MQHFEEHNLQKNKIWADFFFWGNEYDVSINEPWADLWKKTFIFFLYEPWEHNLVEDNEEPWVEKNGCLTNFSSLVYLKPTSII